MARILITGAAGFLGLRFWTWLRTEHPSVDIVGLDDLSGGFLENIPQGGEFYQIDCGQAGELFASQHFDYVFHFAAYAAECMSPFVRQFNYLNNIVATAGLINECICHDVKRLVFTSSAAVYGQAVPPFDESQPLRPSDPYGVAKLACEMDLRIAREQHGLDFCILRPHNIFGAGQNLWDGYRNVLGIWMRQLREGKPITIFGDGDQRRAFTAIDNCLEPIWNAAVRSECSGRTINLGSDTHRSVNEVADALISIFGAGEKRFVEARHEVRNAYCRHDLARELLDYRERVSFEDGLRDMWEWARMQPSRPTRPGPPVELDKGLYPTWQR